MRLALIYYSWLYWDPPRHAVTIPVIQQPIAWYGLLFVLGFMLAYAVFLPRLTRVLIRHPSNILPRERALLIADRLCWSALVGTVIGARLGQVFFYEWTHFKAYPLDIFKIWEGGLASHGGVIGLSIALFLSYRSMSHLTGSLTWKELFDQIALPALLVCSCIRLGNFVNQEILGTPTTMPWGIIFGHPADGSSLLPRHPVQLYEAVAYLLLFSLIIWGQKWGNFLHRPGATLGIVIACGFMLRLILEHWKAHQGTLWPAIPLQTGQLLSIPFIVLGVILLVQSRSCEKSTVTSL